MQETTLLDTQPHNDSKSTIEKLEKSSVTKHNNLNNYQSANVAEKSSSKGDVDAPHDSIETERGTEKSINNKEGKGVENSQQTQNEQKGSNGIDSDVRRSSNKTDESNARTEMLEGIDNEHKDCNGESEKEKKSPPQTMESQCDNNAVGTGNDKEILSPEKKNGKLVTAVSQAGPPPTTTTVATAAPPPPIMRGTLSIDLNGQRHLIRGMWNYENSTALPPQRFELVRNLEPDEDKTKLPVDGVFNGSFSLAYIHLTSKGKQKERSKVIQETGVAIKFTPVPGKDREYEVEGRGTNQFGIFHISGTAEPSSIPDDPTLSIVLRKRYEPGEPAPVIEPIPENTLSDSKHNKNKKPVGTASTSVLSGTTSMASLAGSDLDNNTGPLPDPTKSFPSGVVALRGNLYKEESTELGISEVVHRINGMWAAGLDIMLADPQNVQGLCNRFEYEHKSSSPSQQFPVSGRYSGWFELSNEDNTRTRINERDVTLKFRLNNAGYHNIEGKGSNVFGKYTITGTLTLDNVITIFRTFLPRKIKTKQTTAPIVVPAPGGSAPDPVRHPSLLSQTEQKLTLDDVEVPNIDPAGADSDQPNDSISPPLNGTYSAVSQGVLRLNEDGSHSCQGKWAVTREHFTNSLTHPFNFRLETHHAQAAMNAANSENGETQQFPLDSAMYKGSFQMKKQGSRNQTIIDLQIVMKFRKNKQGSFNVYGTGINAIGEFNLLGTLVMSGKTGGQVELYRIYKPEKLAVTEPEIPPMMDEASGIIPTDYAKPEILSSMFHVPPLNSVHSSMIPPPGSLLRRESTRMSKLPSRLEEDDPTAQVARMMEKCTIVLKFMRERDAELGSFFAEPVDPVRLGIPTYHQVIKEPMDLKTVQRKMDQNEITTPEEFMRLVRLIFENAIRFNIEPGHSVHAAARTLLGKFNDRIKDVERVVQSMRRTHGTDDKDKKKKKDDKKRKRQSDEPKSLKRQRLDEVESMLSSNSQAFAAIAAAAPVNPNGNVTRTEFNLLLGLLQQLQGQIIQTHTALAELSPGDNDELSGNNYSETAQNANTALKTASATVAKTSRAPSPALIRSEEKKATKRKSEEKKQTEPTEESALPLSHEEQEWLTETISELPPEHLGGVIQIIREAAPVVLDDGEIDIEIDQLDHRTQRNLLKHVLKFVKKSKPKPKKPKQQQQKLSPPRKSNEKQLPVAKKMKPSSKPKPAATTESLFSFGGKDSSDSDSGSSEDEGEVKSTAAETNKEMSNDFKLSAGLGDLHNDDDDDDLESEGFAGNWNISDPVTSHSAKNDDEQDDLDWAAAAREQAAASKARDADRKAREEKKKKETEEANKKALAEAAKRKEELLAKQADLLEQQEKEAEKAREAAREQARAEAQSLQQTVDLDAQREIMKQFDQSFLDNESMGGASPSSDFEF